MNSLHKRLALQALSRGNRARDFKFAAQKHADVAWFYAIAGGIIWYFLGWGWALIPFGLSILTVIQSISATLIAENIEALLKKNLSSMLMHLDLFLYIDQSGRLAGRSGQPNVIPSGRPFWFCSFITQKTL